jgi:tripartite ATP-independent transporter DctM subunit
MSGDPIGTTILLGVFVLLLVLKVPIALALAAASIGAAMWLDIPLPVIGQRMTQGLASFPLLAIPFFILAGEIMSAGGISRRLIDLANIIIGWLRGGLAVLNVLASTFFGGISGSAVADTSSIGSVMIPMMRRAGYDADYSVGVTISSAAQGVLLPPSHNMIIYALVAGGGVSIGGLFAAGIVPGLLLGLLLMVVAYVMARQRGYPRGERIPAAEMPRIIWQALLGLLTPIIIIGGILSGIFTATESAAIAVVYAFLVTFVAYREIELRDFITILARSMRTLATVLFLIAAASAFGHLLTVQRIPRDLTVLLTGLSDNPIVILLIINLMLLALGAIMDMAPLILITTPILLPVAMGVGMDPTHFGVMLMLNLSLGLITPPVGSVLFVGSALGDISIEQATKGVLPFYLPMLAALLIITFVPALSLTLPQSLGF